MSLKQCALSFISGSFGRVKREFVRPAVIAAAIAAMLVALGASSAVAQQKPGAELDGMAQAQISATIGKDQAGYHFVAKGNSFAAENVRNSLSADFSSAGVSFRSGSNQWGMTLRGYGYGDNLVASKLVAPHANANRLEYSREGLTEWYVNGPVGLEQGFTFAKAPARINGAPLTLALILSGNLTAAVDESGRGVLLQKNGSVVLRYGGLVASDASGSDLHASMEVVGNELRFHIDDKGAQYPVTIDPMVQSVKLTNSAGICNEALLSSRLALSPSADTCSLGQPGDEFAYSSAVSSDGSVLVETAPTVTVNGANMGAAYIFVRPRTGWGGCITVGCDDYVARLTPSDGAAGDGFGVSVSMSGDGNTIVVLEEPQFLGPGTAYVYVKPSTGWGNATETARLTIPSSDIPSSGFWISSISTNGDGSLVAYGFSGALVNGSSNGAVYLYIRPSAGWVSTSVQNAKLTASDGVSGDQLGHSVAVSSDGNTVAAGAPFWPYAQTGFETSQGAVYVFMKQPVLSWSDRNQAGKLTNSFNEVGFQIGDNVAISANGNTVAALGGPYANATDIWVFLEPSTQICFLNHCFLQPQWSNVTQAAVLNSQDFGIGDSAQLAMSGDGSTIAASSLVFARPPEGWSLLNNETQRLTASDGTPLASTLGQGSIAINGDGSVVVAGNPFATVGSNTDQGAAFVFSGFAGTPAAQIAPSLLNFGNQIVATTSNSQTVTLTNVGNAPLTISSEVVSSQFTATQSCLAASPLAAGASCADNVAFAPTSTGAINGTLTFTTNSTGSPTGQVGLSGTGIVTATSTTVSSSLNPSTYGQPVTFTAVVTNASRVPTGNVTFTIDTTSYGPFGLSAGRVSFTPPILNAGSHSVVATYLGDTPDSFDPSTSVPLTQIVNLATSTTTLTSSVNPSYVGQNVTYTATIASQYGGTVNGNVAFKQGTTTLATVPLPLPPMPPQVSYTPTPSYSTAGTYNITAVYNGGTNNIGSTSAVLHQTVKALPIATTTVVTTSGSPSFINQPITFTATISSTDGVPDNATVTFFDGATVIGTTTSSSGVAMFSTTSLTARTHTIRATYAGDATFKTSSGTVTQVVTLYPTTTTVTAAPNAITFGQTVLLTATVTSTGPSTPAGNVRFTAGTTNVGSAPLNTGGVAILSTTKIPAGTTAITATYVSTDGVSATSSGTAAMSVAQATTTTSVVSSLNPANAGQSVRFTATVSSPTTIPTGSVTFMDGATALATVNLGGGKAAYTTTTLTSGTHDITVVYTGTPNIVGSTSPVLVQTVN
ncbi:MAG TPA: Ig-like domain repeat protein [Terriglobales bacterium]|nr:Ig-like domain repeat protein [Terriglobales bacterium]